MLEPLNPLAHSDWDERLEDFPDATFFHTAAWARVLNATYSFRPRYVGHTAGGQLKSVLPMMEVNSWITGRRGVMLPFTDECGPLLVSPDLFPELWAHVLAEARSRSWRYVECRGRKELFPAAPSAMSFFTHNLDLTHGENRLFTGCHDSTRRAVRKAEQSDLYIEFDRDESGMRDFYHLHGLTRKRHGLPVQPVDFFDNIHRHVVAKGNGCVVIARYGRRPVAGALFLLYRDKVIFKFGASDSRAQSLRANFLVMWSAIKNFAEQGFKNFNFGRTSLLNEGLRQFKRGWGSTEDRIDYVKFDSRAGIFTHAKDESTGWHNRIFRHLPVPLLRMTGNLLYKHAA